MNGTNHPGKIGGRVRSKFGAIQLLKLSQIIFQPSDFLFASSRGIVFQLGVVLMKTDLGGFSWVKFKLKVKILVHQHVEGGNGVRGRPRSGGKTNQSG